MTTIEQDSEVSTDLSTDLAWWLYSISSKFRYEGAATPAGAGHRFVWLLINHAYSVIYGFDHEEFFAVEYLKNKGPYSHYDMEPIYACYKLAPEGIKETIYPLLCVWKQKAYAHTNPDKEFSSDTDHVVGCEYDYEDDGMYGWGM